MTRVLIINLGWEQQPLIDRLAALGVRLYGVHYDNNYYRGVRYEQVTISDLRDLTIILDVAATIRPHVVIADQCDYSHFAQSIVAKTCNIPGPSLENAQISANKYLQRERAREAGLRIPEYQLIRYPFDLFEFIRKVGLPIILKPIDNRGSFGVTRVDVEEEVSDAYLAALKNSHSRLVLAERFIVGLEITVDGYCFNGFPRSLALATKGKVDDKKQISVDIRYPGELPPDIYERVMSNNETVTRALGYSFGFTHSEYILDEHGEPYLIESANRGGGVFTSEVIVPAVTGMDLIGVYIDDCFGHEGGSENSIDDILVVMKNKVVLKFFSFAPGVVRKILGRESLQATNDGVLKGRLMIEPGDRIDEVDSDATRHGFVIVTDPVDAVRKADKIIESVKVEYVGNEP